MAFSVCRTPTELSLVPSNCGVRSKQNSPWPKRRLTHWSTYIWEEPAPMNMLLIWKKKESTRPWLIQQCNQNQKKEEQKHCKLETEDCAVWYYVRNQPAWNNEAGVGSGDYNDRRAKYIVVWGSLPMVLNGDPTLLCRGDLILDKIWLRQKLRYNIITGRTRS